jgi:hypothetical protein
MKNKTIESKFTLKTNNTMTTQEILNKISSGEIKKSKVSFYDTEKQKSINLLCENGFEGCVCDINSAPFYIELRYQIQTVKIPADKRGNLKKYAGKTVDIIATTVSRGGPRINFYIREHLNV